MPLEVEPRYDYPISGEWANEYVQNYLNNDNYKPADFTAFFFHADELRKFLDNNKDLKYVKFTLGMKYIYDPKTTPPIDNTKLYGCAMISRPEVPVPNPNSLDKSLVDGDDNIYDYSHPVPPYPPEG